MKLCDYKLKISYVFDGQRYTVDGENQHVSFKAVDSHSDRLVLDIVAKEKIELLGVSLRYSRVFTDDSKVYINGYQSWTISREFTMNDVQKGLLGPSKIGIVKKISQACGDYFFTRYSNKPGYFHSFTYTYIKECGKIELIGSLSERQAYTIIYFDMRENEVSIEKDVEGLTLEKGQTYNLYNIRSFVGEYDKCFDAYFAAMEIKKPRKDLLAGYTSWYNYYQNINEEIILRDLDGLMRAKDVSNIFQIDDGFETFVGDWRDLDPVKFPNGLKPIVDKVHSKGLLAGLWLAPFSAQFKAKVLKEHPDWTIKTPDGKNVYSGFAWGGFYALDFYKPEVAAYIKACFDEVFDKWGFDMVKLDFLYSACIQPRYNKTRGTIMCEAMDFLRKCCRDKLILGCGVPLGPAFGIVDACRIGSDAEISFKEKAYVKLTNQEIISTRHAINNSIFRRHLNGRAFISDPDVFFLRNEPTPGSGKTAKYNETQKELLAKVNNLCGNVLFVSDNVGDYGEARLAQLKKYLVKSDAVIIDANYLSADELAIDYTVNGQRMKLTFNIRTGEHLEQKA